LRVSDQQGEQVCLKIADWLKLLEPIDELSNNINDQILYLEFALNGIVNSNAQGIIRYQNKVCKELFSQAKNGNSRSIMLFSVCQDKPVVTLYKEGTPTFITVDSL
jgi:hypothetical protein